jgi:RsiW-degrading membrane proteinase PrsW (M82 family)
MRKAMQVAAMLVGLGSAAFGVIGGMIYALLPWLGQEAGSERLTGFAIAGASVALGCGLGLPLAWTALQSLAGKPSRRLRWPHTWLLLLIFTIAVIMGQIVLSFAPLPWLFFPYFYVLGGVLPVVIVLSIVGSRLALGGLAPSWREVLAQLGSGAFLGTTAAFVLETVGIVLVAVAAAVVVALTPGAEELLQELMAEPLTGGLPDMSRLLPLVRSPWAMGLVVLALAVLAPALEEAVKSLGVLLMGYRRPGRARAFVWGVAGGAGFALVEGLLSGSLALREEQSWAFAIVARGGTAVIHCLAGGLVGLGWQALLSRERRYRLLLYYSAAVALHGLWNGLVTGVSYFGLLSSGAQGASGSAPWTDMGTALTVILLLLLLLGQFVLLLTISGRLARSEALAEIAEGREGSEEREAIL